MRMSQLFTKTRKEAPADEQSKNAQLLIQAGFIHKEMAGVYTYLPLGKKVLDNIIKIIREEMNAIGGNEIVMTTLQDKYIWEKSGRWSEDVVDVWFKTKLLSGAELGLGFTHEESVTSMMKNFIRSYKDLPAYPYQFQSKFRNELRAKSGLMRGREFLMKDLYSFSKDQKQHDEFYAKAADAYSTIYRKLGIGNTTYKTFASGGSFSKFSHEFQTLSYAGEDTIYISKEKNIAINEEVLNDDVLKDFGIKKEELVKEKAVEVGNIFTLGTKFSEVLDLTYVDQDGSNKFVFMGSYGIGPSRLMGLIAEHFADDNGLVWPSNIAPAELYLIILGDNADIIEDGEKLYEDLTKAGVEVIYDDRDERAGEKFADADLLGIPYRLVLSEKTLKNKQVEVKKRQSSAIELMDVQAVIKMLASS